MINPVARVDLPTTLLREVSRVIVRWAYIEHFIQQTIYVLVGVPKDVGRLAIREPRLADRITLINDLLYVRGYKIKPRVSKSIINSPNKAVEIRDLFAHGIWTFDDAHEHWAIQNTRGNWNQNPEKTNLTGKKRIKPEGLLVSQDAIRSTVKNLETIMSNLGHLDREIYELLNPSHGKQPPQFDLLDRLPDQSQKKQQRPPSSSQE